jgi:hypothetical protein
MTLTELRHEVTLAQPHFFGRVAAGYLLKQATGCPLNKSALSIACLAVKKLIPTLGAALCHTTYGSKLSRIIFN